MAVGLRRSRERSDSLCEKGEGLEQLNILQARKPLQLDQDQSLQLSARDTDLVFHVGMVFRRLAKIVGSMETIMCVTACLENKKIAWNKLVPLRAD